MREGTTRPAPLGAIVRVQGAQAKPEKFTLGSGTCVIGSAPACDIVISEPTVSRMHVELCLMPEGVSVRDLGSRNGVFYLGQVFEEFALFFCECLGRYQRDGNKEVAATATAKARHSLPFDAKYGAGLCARRDL